MPNRSSKPKRPCDINELAYAIAQESTRDELEQEQAEPKPEKNPHAQALGRLGGRKGGKARAEKLTPERRREIAKKAAQTRWGKGR